MPRDKETDQIIEFLESVASNLQNKLDQVETGTFEKGIVLGACLIADALSEALHSVTAEGEDGSDSDG